MSRAKTRAALLQELEERDAAVIRAGVPCSGKPLPIAPASPSSDLECLDFVNLEGRVTAGRLAELTGLTTGAITGVVDRLEKAGFVRRERDESDRRKVFIATVPENGSIEIGRFYEPMQRGDAEAVWNGYSDAELKLLLRFMPTTGYKAMLEATEAAQDR